MDALKDIDPDEGQFLRIEALLQSMTPNEREEKCELSVPRRKRIAKAVAILLKIL